MRRNPPAVPRTTAWIALAAVAGLLPFLSLDETQEPFGAPWQLGWLLLLGLLLSLALLRARAARGDRGAAENTATLVGALVFVLSYAAFVANYDTLTANDNLPNRAIPQALLSGHGFDLAPVVPAKLHGLYSFAAMDGGLLSAFPLGTGLLATPYYALAGALGAPAGELEGRAAARLEKHAASLLSALGVLFFFLASAALVKGLAARALLSLALATGTPVLTSLSQGLWSQTGEFVLLALAAFLVARPGAGFATDLAGGCVAGAAFLCRPTAILLLPVAWCFARRPLRAAGPFGGGVAIAIGASLALNHALAGNPLGAYLQLYSTQRVWGLAGLPARLAGVLFSPSRGVAWFFPALVAAAATLLVARRRLSRAQLAIAAACAASIVAVILLTAGYKNWWGGHSTGPRLLAEISIPALAICALALPLAPRAVRALLVALLCVQSVVQLRIYDFRRARNWNQIVDLDRSSQVLFSVRNSLLAAAFVPDWTYRAPSEGYFRPAQLRFDAASWRELDISPAVNADYGEWRPSGPEEVERWRLYLPRLDPGSLGASNPTGFRFLPPGRWNMIRLCAGESARVDLRTSPAFGRLAAVLSWRGSEAPSGSVGRFVLSRPNGAALTRELRLGHEVFDPAAALAPPAGRTLAGRWSDFDELVGTAFTLPRRASYAALEIYGPPPDTPGCLYVLALAAR